MNFKSYVGKVYVVKSSQTWIRDDNLAPVKYKQGDTIPPGSHVGDPKKIPAGTEINVTDVRSAGDHDAFVFARPANDPASSFGWTMANNLAGGMLNETAGFSPSQWAREPEGNNMTVFIDPSFIRGGPPNLTSTGNKIPRKSYVMVTERFADGKHVKVSKLDIVNGEMIVGEEIGWTRLSNLLDGCSEVFFTPEWENDKGPNACWKGGVFIGAKVMVNVIGNAGDLEQTTFDSYVPYFKLTQAAAAENIPISINSAFRTWHRQAILRDLYEHHNGNSAARPGRSDHQHGQAFDLNTGDLIVGGVDKIYQWLKKNAPKHGFIRTVPGERWHWEYLPEKAAQMGPGQFGVDD